jgi:antirestriction protein
MKLEPKIWVGCLGCYNGGTLAGQWMDATEGDEITPDKIEGPGPYHVSEGHEELWVLDHEGFGGFLSGECSPMEAARIARVIEDIQSEGFDASVVGAWAENNGETITEWDAPTSDRFTDAYAGTAESDRDFAQEFFDNSGYDLDDLPAMIKYCIDWDSVAQGLDFWTARVDGETHYFWQ